jgi:Family of unknown function (DUF6917)
MDTRVDTTAFVTLATYAANRPVEGEVVTVMDAMHEARALKLIPTYTRALRSASIHELIATDETRKRPGDSVNRIAYLGFFEVVRGGMVIVGEVLLVDGQHIGEVMGFDETHEPNHINIVIGVAQRRPGRQLNLSIGNHIKFIRP